MILNRTVKILELTEWVDYTWEALKVGDVFSIFEPDGTPLNQNGYIARSEPYDIEGVLGIKCDTC